MKRRMLCDDILDSGKFLRLPPSTQALYAHCVMGTDDDGIVDLFTVMRKVGAKEDDVVLLVEREFITPLDPKEYIFWVTGFQDFNKIPSHIKEDSKYLPLLLASVQGITVVKSTKIDDNKRRYAALKLQRNLDKSGENKRAYKKRKENLQSKINDPNRITDGSFSDHDHDPKTRIGKDRIEEDKKRNPLTPLQGEGEPGELYSTSESITQQDLERIAASKRIRVSDVESIFEQLKGWKDARKVVDWNLTLQGWVARALQRGDIKVNRSQLEEMNTEMRSEGILIIGSPKE